MSEPQRIAKLLARAGVASRRDVERMIAEGRVAIDGVAVEKPATLLTSLKGVTVDGQPVKAAEFARLFIYHKPPGLLTAARDPQGRPTIYDRLPRGLPRVMPVGRLDLNTEGLLLLTTDGGLKRQLELPATGVERAYRARAYGQVSQTQLEALMLGVEIEGVRYGSINANLERRTGANVWIEMVLKEGKNREVRRVLEYLGLEVSRLIRTRYGPFALADLPPGAVAEVRPQDVAAFSSAPTRTDIPVQMRVWAPPAAKPAPAATPETAPSKVRAQRPARPGKRSPGDAVANPARAARARAHRAATGRDEAPAAKPRIAADRPSRPAPGARGENVAKPARAARARTHRAATGREEASVPKPRKAGDRPARPAPDARGKPRRGGPRPPRTRK